MTWKIKRAGKTLPVRPMLLFVPRPRRMEWACACVPVRATRSR